MKEEKKKNNRLHDLAFSSDTSGVINDHHKWLDTQLQWRAHLLGGDKNVYKHTINDQIKCCPFTLV